MASDAVNRDGKFGDQNANTGRTGFGRRTRRPARAEAAALVISRSVDLPWGVSQITRHQASRSLTAIASSYAGNAAM
jgi:hypothetical protein